MVSIERDRRGLDQQRSGTPRPGLDEVRHARDCRRRRVSRAKQEERRLVQAGRRLVEGQVADHVDALRIAREVFERADRVERHWDQVPGPVEKLDVDLVAGLDVEGPCHLARDQQARGIAAQRRHRRRRRSVDEEGVGQGCRTREAHGVDCNQRALVRANDCARCLLYGSDGGHPGDVELRRECGRLLRQRAGSDPKVRSEHEPRIGLLLCVIGRDEEREAGSKRDCEGQRHDTGPQREGPPAHAPEKRAGGQPAHTLSIAYLQPACTKEQHPDREERDSKPHQQRRQEGVEGERHGLPFGRRDPEATREVGDDPHRRRCGKKDKVQLHTQPDRSRRRRLHFATLIPRLARERTPSREIYSQQRRGDTRCHRHHDGDEKALA